MKSSLLSIHTFQSSLAEKLKSKWILTVFLLPVALYVAFLLFEEQIVTFALPFFPNEPDKTVAFYRDLVHLGMREMLWYSGFALLTWMIWRNLSVQRLSLNGWLTNCNAWAAGVIAITFITCCVVAYHTLEKFPNSSDEYAYVFQAETMSQGKLWEKAHDLPDFFFFNNIAQKDGVRAGRFPPGWPGVMAIFLSAGIPAYLVNPILGLITLIVFYFFARRFYGPKIGLAALVAMAFTSYFLFTAASFFSHISCTLACLAFIFCLHLWQEKQHAGYALLAGFFIGMVIVTRYFTAVLIFIPFFITLIYHHRLRAFILFFWMGVGSVPCLTFLFWYNYSITGNFLLPVTMWAYQNESLGFVRGHSFMKGVEHSVRWGLMFLYWCSPGLILLYVIYLFRKIKDRADRFLHPEDYAFVFLLGGYFFYYEIGGNQYGPRFLFEAFPFLVLFVIRKLFQFQHRWAIALLFAGAIYAVAKFPFITQREHRVIEDRLDVYRLAEKNKLHHAVVLIASRVSVIRPMPIGDLTRNDVAFRNDVLYAFDIPGRNKELFAYYPQREFYRYVREPNNPRGRLIRIEKNE
jgi:hypothetical protein